MSFPRSHLGSALGVSSQQSGWTGLFMKSPDAYMRVPEPPGIASASDSTRAQANLAFNSVPSFPAQSYVPSLTAESRRDELRRIAVPRCDVHFDPANPSRTLLDWDTC
eukprot:6476917-Amphidinium_carterae.1